MKRAFLALALVASLSACGVNQGGVGSAGSTALAISKATGAADSAYIAAYTTGVAAMRAGTLSRADFLKWEAVAYNAVLLVRAAKTIADLTAAQAQLSAATAKLTL